MAVPLLCIQLGVTVYEDDFVDDVVVSGMYIHDAASPVFESVGSPSLVSTYSPRGRVITGPSRGMSARRRLSDSVYLDDGYDSVGYGGGSVSHSRRGGNEYRTRQRYDRGQRSPRARDTTLGLDRSGRSYIVA